MHRGKFECAQDLLDDARFVELSTNLDYFEARYGEILKQLEQSQSGSSASQEDAQWRGLLRRYLQDQLRDAQRMIATLESEAP